MHGLFAIANAMSIANGQHPENLNYGDALSSLQLF